MQIQKVFKKNRIVALLILCAIVLTGIRLLFNYTANAMAQFLNVNKPIDNAQVLLVEGWVHNGTLKYVKEEFSKGPYRYILISGMHNELSSVQIEQEKIDSDASLVSQELIDMGIDQAKIKVSACHLTSIHKTFSMALEAKKWFTLNDPSVRRINICTSLSHGRKTWSAYKRVFGNNIKTGILTFPKRQVPMSRWFFYRSGFRYQFHSFAGYIYAALWPLDLLDTH